MTDYQVGDVLFFKGGDDCYIEGLVRITGKSPDIMGRGKAGWDGTLLDGLLRGADVWGYDAELSLPPPLIQLAAQSDLGV